VVNASAASQTVNASTWTEKFRQAQRSANLFLMFEPGITPLVIATKLVDCVDVQLFGQIDHDLIGRIERVGQERPTKRAVVSCRANPSR
jgi:hypothetical protein